jgi:hypothetical protein
MDTTELAALFAKGGDLSVMEVVKNYIPEGEFVNDFPAGKNVKENYGIVVSILVNYQNDNFKKPISKLTAGIMITFKGEHFYHNSRNCFPINWEDLNLMTNLRDLDINIVRSYTLLVYN